MTLIVMPTSFETALLDRLVAANERHAEKGLQVAELYGSLPRTTTGTGRPSRSLPDVDRNAFAAHVQEVRSRGLSFTCLINTSCTGNREFDTTARALIVDEMRWARDIGCRALVVASPFLIELARRHVPGLRIHISSIAFAKSTNEARHYVEAGATRLVLDPDTVRDFRSLRRLRESCPDLELEALCNHPCLLHCPYETYCYNSVSHGSNCAEQVPYEGFSLLQCHMDKLSDPAQFVKGSWFRPQDVHLFEQAGVFAIKIAGRGRSTEWLAQTAEAYLSRHYEGDLMDLVWEAQWTAVWRSVTPDAAPPFPVRLPAKSFDGFLEHFARHQPDCLRGCGSCHYCDDVAGRALEVDEAALHAGRVAMRRSLDGLLE